MKKSIIIFGSGYHGRLALRKLENSKKNLKILYFLDNDKKKYYSKCLGKKIFPVTKIANTKFDKLIMCGRNIEQQINQLKEFNIPSNKFIFLGKSEIRPNKKILLLRSRILFKMLKYIINTFNKEKVEYWIDYSGLLSLLRKDDLAELSDVEISVNIKNIKQIEKNLSKNNIFTQILF